MPFSYKIDISFLVLTIFLASKDRHQRSPTQTFEYITITLESMSNITHLYKVYKEMANDEN